MKKNNSEKGQVTVMILIASVVLVVLIGTIAMLMKQENKWMVKSKKSTVALHIADAAIDRVIYKLQIGNNWDNITNLIGYRNDVTYSDISGGTYVVNVIIGDATNQDSDDDGIEDDEDEDDDDDGIEDDIDDDDDGDGIEDDDDDGDEEDEDEDDEDEEGEFENRRTVIITSTATGTGERRKLQAVLSKTTLNRGLSSGGQALLGGSSDVYWGPIISYSIADPSINVGTNSVKDHPEWYAMGHIHKQSGAEITTASYSNYHPNTPSSSMPAVVNLDFNYFKAVAKSTNTYFASDVTHSTSQIADHSPPAAAVHNANQTHYPPIAADFTSLATQYTQDIVIFVDTTDKLAYNGTNGCGTVTMQGNYNHGTLIVMGDLDFGGNGTGSLSVPIPSTAEGQGGPDEPNPYTINFAIFKGLIYVADDFTATGTPAVFGCMIVGDSPNNTGNVKIYYDENLNINGTGLKTISVSSWRELVP
ncbi:MAG: hypothetical protein AABY84_05970 [Candidatus Firestonebacteria bacterium]